MGTRSIGLFPCAVALLLSGADFSHLWAQASYPVMPVELVQYEEETAQGLNNYHGTTEQATIDFLEVQQADDTSLAKVLRLRSVEPVNPPVEKEFEGLWNVKSLQVDELQRVLTVFSQKDPEPALVFIQAVPPFAILATVDLKKASAEQSDAWPFETWPVAIDRKRVFFAQNVPEPLRPYFPEGQSLSATDYWWLDRIHPEHLHLVEGADKALEAATEDLRALIRTGKATKDDRQALPILEKILGAKLAKEPIPASELEGDWKVRSIQAVRVEEGAIIYPWFKAKVTETSGQALFFEKTTGSQRRSGLLLPTQEGGWVFLGGVSMNDDPQTAYSRILHENAEWQEPDSVGVVCRAGPDHWYLILDAADNLWWEIYELRASDKTNENRR